MNYGKLTAGTTKTAIDTAKPSEKGEIITYLSRMGDVLGPVADGVEVIAALHRGIHAIVDNDETDILLGKIYLHVVAHLKVFTPQAGGVLYDEIRHLSRFDHLHDLFPRRPLEVRTRVAVIRKEDGVLEALFFCVFLQQGALRRDLSRAFYPYCKDK